jgi:hypothetical protein
MISAATTTTANSTPTTHSAVAENVHSNMSSPAFSVG